MQGNLAKAASVWDRVGRWAEVPDRVCALYAEVAGDALEVASAVAGIPDRVYWNRRTKEAAAWRDPRLCPIDPTDHDWILVKRAAEDFLRPAADTFSTMQRPLGGPHPLAASIVGGLLGSGIGYAGGALVDNLVPQWIMRRGPLRHTLAAAGGLLGATPGMIWGANNMRMPDDTGGGFSAWTSGFPFAKKALQEVADWALRAESSGIPFAREGKSASRFDALELPWELPAEFTKAAYNLAGGLYVPRVPVDAFNRAIWTDVLAPPNPFGTKDYRGDDEQPLTTPPAVAAAISGLVAGAGAATGRRVVSPLELGLTAATAAGKGYLAGTIAGGVLGALAGLTPEAQSTLRQTGLWGGLLTGVAQSLFGP